MPQRPWIDLIALISGQQGAAHVAQAVIGKLLRHTRRMDGKPVVQNDLGALDDRHNRPQRVIQIEQHGFNG